MSKGLFEITFKGVDELLKVAERRSKLLDANVRVAVARTVLWGAARIAEDCPVDTGRLRSSIMGYLAKKYGISLKGDAKAIAEGLQESVTEASGYDGRIGTNVEYALYQEYGVGGREVGKTSRSGATLYAGGFRGKGFFRMNIPLIDMYFQIQMREAINLTERDKLMRVTF